MANLSPPNLWRKGSVATSVCRRACRRTGRPWQWETISRHEPGARCSCEGSGGTFPGARRSGGAGTPGARGSQYPGGTRFRRTAADCPRHIARTDVPVPARGGHSLPCSRRPGGRAVSHRRSDRLDRAGRGPGDAQSARLGCAAGARRTPCARRSRRRRTQDRGARSGSWGRGDPGRRRTRTGRRRTCRWRRADGR